jgi:colicin import membrane protein
MNWFSAVFLVTLFSACTSSPQVVDTNMKIDFPSTGRIDSVTQADDVLEAVELSRAQIEWRYQQIEQVCYTRFFVNSCLSDAKVQRRINLAKIKKSEVEASFFKRKTTVEEMDKALAEKNIRSALPDGVPEIQHKP